MRAYLTGIIILFLLSHSIFTYAETSKIVMCNPRVPKIEYAEAIKIAFKSNIVGTEAESKKLFVDSANLICEHNKQHWIITLRKRDLETGQLIINVYMDGTTDTSVMKDG